MIASPRAPRSASWSKAVLSAPGALLALGVLLPVGALAIELVRGGDAASQLVSVLGSADMFALLGRSVALAGGVSVLATIIGVPLGILLGRTDIPGRGWLLALHAFPMFLPPFLPALGWFHVLGVNGYVGSPTTASLFFGPVGALGVLGATFAPVVTCLTALALQNVDPSLEEAGRVVARPMRVVQQILLPIAFPAIAFAILLVFALTLSELAVPMFLRVRTYPASVLARLGGVSYAPGEAVALTVPLLALTLGLLMVERRFAGQRMFAVLGLRHAERALFALGRWRFPTTVACALAAALSVVPLAALLSKAFPDGIAALPDWIRSSLWNSLTTATMAATVITALGLSTAWSFAQGRSTGRVLDAVLMLGFLIPGAVLGVGLIAVWNHEVTRPVYGSLAILVLGLLARYAIVGVRVMGAAIAQSPRSLEEAAAVFGVGPLGQLRRIVVPLHLRGIVAAWLATVVFCLRDLDSVILFYPPGLEPLTVRIFTLEANGPPSVVAALALAQVAITALLLGGVVTAAKAGRWTS